MHRATIRVLWVPKAVFTHKKTRNCWKVLFSTVRDGEKKSLWMWKLSGLKRNTWSLAVPRRSPVGLLASKFERDSRFSVSNKNLTLKHLSEIYHWTIWKNRIAVFLYRVLLKIYIISPHSKIIKGKVICSRLWGEYSETASVRKNFMLKKYHCKLSRRNGNVSMFHIKL